MVTAVLERMADLQSNTKELWEQVPQSSDYVWGFQGEMCFYDNWDFDPGGRDKLNDFKTTVGAVILPGKPFIVTSESVAVEQTSLDPDMAMWE